MKKFAAAFFSVALMVILASMFIPGLLADDGLKELSLPAAYKLSPTLVYTSADGTKMNKMIYDEKVFVSGSDNYIVLVGGSSAADQATTITNIKVEVPVPASAVTAGSVVVGATTNAAVPAATNSPSGTDAVLGVAAVNFGPSSSTDITLKSSHPAVTVSAAEFSSNKIVYTLAVNKKKLAAPKNPSDFIEVDLTMSIPSNVQYQILADNKNKAAKGPIFEAGDKVTLKIKFYDKAYIIDDSKDIVFDAVNEAVYSGSSGAFTADKTYYVSLDGKKFTGIKAVAGASGTFGENKIGFYLGKVLDNKKATAFYISANPNAGKKNQPPEYVVTCTKYVVTGSNQADAVTNTVAAGGIKADDFKYQAVAPRPKIDKEVKLGYGYAEDGTNTLSATPAEPKWTIVGDPEDAAFDVRKYEYAPVPAIKTTVPEYDAFTADGVPYLDGTGEIKTNMIYDAKTNPKPASQAYYIRSLPGTGTAVDGNTPVVPAGIAKKFTPAKQKAGPKLKVDYKKEIVKFKAGQQYFVPASNTLVPVTTVQDYTYAAIATTDNTKFTLMTKESDFFKTGIDASKAIGAAAQNIYAFVGATLKAPPSGYGYVETLKRAADPDTKAFDVSKPGAVKLSKGYEVFDDTKQKWGGYKKGTESGQVRVKATKTAAASVAKTYTISVAKEADAEKNTKEEYQVVITT